MLDTQILRLPVDAIAPNPYQPRTDFAPEPLAELADSIRRHGILQPLTVRRTKTGWELVAGERRLRAAKLAGLDTVPCLQIRAEDQESALLALIENIQRKDLHYFEEAAAIAAYLRQSGVTQEEAAALLGRSPSALANKLRLLRLSPDCRKLLVENGLSERHARALLRLDDPGRAAFRPAAHHPGRTQRRPGGAVCRPAAGGPASHAPRRPPHLHPQGCAAVSQQSGPGAAVGSGGGYRRGVPPGGHGGRHSPDHSDPQGRPPGLNAPHGKQACVSAASPPQKTEKGQPERLLRLASAAKIPALLPDCNTFFVERMV